MKTAVFVAVLLIPSLAFCGSTNAIWVSPGRVVDLRNTIPASAYQASSAWLSTRYDPASFGTWTVYDGSSRTNNGTQTTSGNRPSWATNGLTFDGSNDGVFVSQLPTNTGTWAAWVNTTNDTARVLFGGTESATTGNNYALVYLGNGSTTTISDELISVLISAGGNSTRYAWSTTNRTALLNGSWHHVAVTQSGSALRIYCDGSEVGNSNAFNAVTNQWTSSITFDTFMIGDYVYNGASGGENFQGKIADVFLSYGCLTGAEISNMYVSGRDAH